MKNIYLIATILLFSYILNAQNEKYVLSIDAGFASGLLKFNNDFLYGSVWNFNGGVRLNRHLYLGGEVSHEAIYSHWGYDLLPSINT